jgi:hypothetical protein
VRAYAANGCAGEPPADLPLVKRRFRKASCITRFPRVLCLHLRRLVVCPRTCQPRKIQGKPRGPMTPCRTTNSRLMAFSNGPMVAA